jgi:hypothetical protein
MQAVCPHTDLLMTQTASALATLLPDCRFIDVSTPGGYYDLLMDCWSTGRSFLVIEHDIVPTAEAIESLARCRQPWCSCPYSMGLGSLPSGIGLGCTRFAGRLTRRLPDAMTNVNISESHGAPPRTWQVTDARVYMELNRHGLEPHIHWDHPVTHLHDYRNIKS